MHSIAATRRAPDLIGDRDTKLVALTVVCAPIWWVLGFNLFIYHLTAAVVFLCLVASAGYANRKIAVPLPAWFLLGVAAIYGFAIALNAASYDKMRVVAALNNATYWVMGFMLVTVLAARFRTHQIGGLLRVFAILGVVNILVAVVALLIARQGVDALTLPTPLSPLASMLGNTALVDYSVQVRLITPDYFSDTATPRFNLYAPYPTAAGAFFMISLPMLAAWAAYHRKLASIPFVVLFAGHILGLAMTLARMSVIALVVSAAAVYVLQKRNWLLWALLIALLLVVGAPAIQRSAASVVAAREGSSNSRFQLYRDSVAQLNDVEWLVGRGIRTYSDKHRMPMGSHSTYVSLLYRTGLCGLGTFLLFQAIVLIRWLQLKPHAQRGRESYLLWRAFGVVFLSMGLWMLTEDIDVPQLLAFTYFSSIGVFESLRSQLLGQTSGGPKRRLLATNGG